jgi:hypothetical protein
MNWNPISAIASVIGGVFEKREDRKKVKISLAGKLALQKDGNTAQSQFNDQEIDMLSKINEGESWKDEYLTVIITMPIPVLFISVFIGVLIGNPLLIDAAMKSIDAIKTLIPDYGTLIGVTVAAGLGIRAWKK